MDDSFLRWEDDSKQVWKKRIKGFMSRDFTGDAS